MLFLHLSLVLLLPSVAVLIPFMVIALGPSRSVKWSVFDVIWPAHYRTSGGKQKTANILTVHSVRLHLLNPSKETNDALCKKLVDTAMLRRKQRHTHAPLVIPLVVGTLRGCCLLTEECKLRLHNAVSLRVDTYCRTAERPSLLLHLLHGNSAVCSRWCVCWAGSSKHGVFSTSGWLPCRISVTGTAEKNNNSLFE